MGQYENAAAFVAAANIGDVFYSSWGYDQTNVDFYEVVRKTAKTVYVREIYGEILTGGGYAGRCQPKPGSFREGEPERRIYFNDKYGYTKVDGRNVRRYTQPVYYSTGH